LSRLSPLFLLSSPFLSPPSLSSPVRFLFPPSYNLLFSCPLVPSPFAKDSPFSSLFSLYPSLSSSFFFPFFLFSLPPSLVILFLFSCSLRLVAPSFLFLLSSPLFSTADVFRHTLIFCQSWSGSSPLCRNVVFVRGCNITVVLGLPFFPLCILLSVFFFFFVSFFFFSSPLPSPVLPFFGRPPYLTSVREVCRSRLP